jgi:hypothetical protein
LLEANNDTTAKNRYRKFNFQTENKTFFILQKFKQKKHLVYWEKCCNFAETKIMETLEIMRNVSRLPLSQQMFVAERIIHSIRQREQSSMEMAVECLCADYATDENLTVFTKLDCENFYEAR